MEKDFRLDHWTVCPALDILQSETCSVSVEPRVMDLLVYLHRHSGEVLTKEQIIRDVWGGAFVTDQAVTYSVTELRRALGDSAHMPRFIRTVPKRGYQLMVSVVATAMEDKQSASGADLTAAVAGGDNGKPVAERFQGSEAFSEC